ncbi:unnamed protein product [Adineta ricciae]|uniref:SecA family profile domain-containing protein n=1 Tax=Adineta ricciae TaxID=249248 RepID=A0A813ZM60_ADIRI|nr:unnamed protein product [Adineta ricciae]CAF1366597.1 unnamed protein product [Adineta ricciae]
MAQPSTNKIQAALLAKLEESRQQYPGDDSQAIYILPDVYNNDDGRIEQCLQEEKKTHAGERTVLIPYFLENFYWTALLIEFQSNGQIERAEFIDPKNEIDHVAHRLQTEFTKVYPDKILQIKTSPTTNSNSTSIVDVLLIAANIRLPIDINHQKEGNEYELAELKEKLEKDLKSYSLQNVDELQTEIEDTKARIEKFRGKRRNTDAQNEVEFLSKLQKLQQLADQIDRWVSNTSISSENHTLKLQKLQENLNRGLIKFNLQNASELPEEIRDTEERIRQFQKRNRKEDVQKELIMLHELQELQKFSEEMRSLTFVSSVSTIQPSQPVVSSITENTIIHKEQTRSLYSEDLRRDTSIMPFCAEKLIMELLIYYEERLSENCASVQEENLETSPRQTLRDQIKKEELLTVEIQTILQNIEIHQSSNNPQLVIHHLNILLKKIRPLNVREIRRLVSEAEKTAELIKDQDIVLLIGDTGSGKSTTIQFLAGCKMIQTKAEVAPGKFLDHITMDGVPTNPQLKKIRSSASHKSETRYIAPVTVQLKDVLGPHETGVITLCDAPGFGDTAGPEVDIANFLGVVEALKGAKSVKLLVVTSYKGLGDRGQGIQKLARILINMILQIEDKLRSICYVFTKYPEININTLLTDIKKCTVDTENSSVRSDSAFAAVLTDMIEKTEKHAFNIHPVHDNPKELLRKLIHMKGIQYPEEVFCFSMSEETRTNIDKHVQRDRLGVNYAIKHKDIQLLLYYLNDLKMLKDLIKKYDAPETYDQSVRLISETISHYCTEEKEKFRRILISRDGLREDDIREYHICIEYLREIQILKEHLGSSLLSPEVLMQFISVHLEERRHLLENEDLDSSLIEIYLNNFRLLKTLFDELEIDYHNRCKEFEKRFDELVESAREPILSNDFKRVVELFTKISKAVQSLKNHLNQRIVETYHQIVELFLRHLNNFSTQTDLILVKIRLTQEDVDVLSTFMEILRSAKESYALREFVSIYLTSFERDSNDLNAIYDEFLGKIRKYFEEIIIRIDKFLETNDEHFLEETQKLIEDMNLIRSIPELESITANAYYRTVEKIRSYVDQTERNIEQLLSNIDHQSENMNSKQLVRSITRLKNTQWVNSISPGTYNSIMKRLTEELVEHSSQLEGCLRKLDLTLKCPENVSKAEEIIEKNLSLSILEQHFPEIEVYRRNICEYFLQCVRVVFDHIERDLNFVNNKDYRQDQNFKQIKESQKPLDPLSADFDEDESKELEIVKSRKQEATDQLRDLHLHLETYDKIVPSKTRTKFLGLFKTSNEKKSIPELEFFKSIGFENIESLKGKITKLQNELRKLDEKETILHKSLTSLRSSLSSSFTEHEKNFPLYKFNDRLRLSLLNNALLYVKSCEQIRSDYVKELVVRINQILVNYLREYNCELDEKTKESFEETIRMNDVYEENYSRYSQSLEINLDELSSLEKLPNIFQYLDGKQKIQHWQQTFINYYRLIKNQLEDYKISDKNKQLRQQLLIVQTLSCVDRFCGREFESNGYGVLYRQYHVDLVKDCRESYKVVLEYIETGDYANVDLQLSHIDDKLMNSKDFDQIKHNLQYSLSKLMNEIEILTGTLDEKIEREGNKFEKIQEIKANLDKIRHILKKHDIMKLIDKEIEIRLKNLEHNNNKILSAIFLIYLESIEAYIEAECFIEAEQSMELFNRILRDLNGYYKSDEIFQKSKELNVRLQNIVAEILSQNDFTEIHNYSINPPKHILAKLEIVASKCGKKYHKAYTSMLDKLAKHWTSAMKNARALCLDDRIAKIHSFKYALQFLPDGLQNSFQSQIDDLIAESTNEENRYKQELQTCISNTDRSVRSILKMRELIEKLCKQKLNELLNQLCEHCLSHVHMDRIDVENYLEKQDIRRACESIEKIYEYKEHLGVYILEIEGISLKVRHLLIRTFLNSCEILANVDSIEQTEKVAKAFSDILLYLDFSTFNLKIEVLFAEETLITAREDFEKMLEYFHRNSKTFSIALHDLNMNDLHKAMFIAKKWDLVLMQIVTCRSKHHLIENFSKNMKTSLSYTNMICELEKLVQNFIFQVNVEFINDDTKKFEVKRDELFNHMKKALNTLKLIDSKFRDMVPLTFDIERLEESLQIKVNMLITQLLNTTSKDELSTKHSNDFRIYYTHLVSLDKHFNICENRIRHALDSVEEKIFEQVCSLRKQITSRDVSIEEISKILIEMKLYAENLPMFNMKINAEIDEALKIYKDKQGMLGIVKMVVELEKSDTGTRLMSEHSCLTGEDWKRRRDKMQNQDDIEYILNRLTGDEISVDVLRSRYKTFRKIYDELISTNLKILDSGSSKDIDISKLVTQIKYIIGTVTHTPKSITWDRALAQEIPELLAYIFAIWTLQNTEHYNAMRGIELSQSYLLIPHVGQVIAIFRLLGIGYDTRGTSFSLDFASKGKTANDLVNNLVEIGTGEGKSVVLAITSCIFALIGIDVNCSCYSEVLSNRDKNDFRLVFRALGIEDRIQYGTFNKLCEQFLNEQCNIREKVHDLIVKNQNVLAKVDTRERLRPKVLLIDEVDVFLSDRFYGGMYTPSIVLKDPSIKGLLDSIWKHKDELRTLNSVKALTPYRNCATRYSNWIFLFDEAIKDMLVALQSYQFSTYIVRDDKISYVEGESVVDNVIRGYDTVWAYYHENEKGKISHSSLKMNVGIIVNCGTFSYAEMPHDFAYIAGVTGTLKTLAKSEKRVLENVYHIHKNTYTPSVFGKNNRVYESTSDVHVVEESEYFKRIRLEIDTICGADRAILVFFESEDKLMAFWNSPELSSIKRDVETITEKSSVRERDFGIRKASTVGKVTLFTRTFGRGTDFICHDPKLLTNGGIHVLQTFFSRELSEEYQIIGRGARHGDRGSYRMILLDKDLEWVLGSTWKTELSKISNLKLYETINNARHLIYESACSAKDFGLDQCKCDHQASKDFMNALCKGSIKSIKTFLTEHNKGANIARELSRTVVLMDATGSMSGLLSAAKETVCTMFERASTILKEKDLPTDVFQMQFVVYRDYDCREDGILQSSSWETKPQNLRNFMAGITAKGGGDFEEAIEIGLWHAVQEGDTIESIAQVILIGDAPAKEREAIERDRDESGGEYYWMNTKFKEPTHFSIELDKLKEKNIPVHAFYLVDAARENFERIARESKGRCQQLNIHSPKGAELLTDFVTEEVLRKAAGSQGDAAVELYRKKYVKKTFLS